MTSIKFLWKLMLLLCLLTHPSIIAPKPDPAMVQQREAAQREIKERHEAFLKTKAEVEAQRAEQLKTTEMIQNRMAEQRRQGEANNVQAMEKSRVDMENAKVRIQNTFAQRQAEWASTQAKRQQEQQRQQKQK